MRRDFPPIHAIDEALQDQLDREQDAGLRADLLSDYLWRRARQKLFDWLCRQRDPLAIWDERVWETPVHAPPGGPPDTIPGLSWLRLRLIGVGGPPVLAALRWWTDRGARAEQRRDVERSLLEKCAADWGKAVLHVFGLGFAGAPWLEALARTDVHFVMRWPRGDVLQDLLGRARPARTLVRGEKTRRGGIVFVALDRQWGRQGVLSIPVRHPVCPGPLWLVVARRDEGREPWYLLTTELADTPAAMWKIVSAYAMKADAEDQRRPAAVPPHPGRDRGVPRPSGWAVLGEEGRGRMVHPQG
jgi:hypothetical protein